MTETRTHMIHTCDRCGDQSPESTPALFAGWVIIDGKLLCENCYTRDEDTGAIHDLRDNIVHVYLDERVHNPDEGTDGHAAVYDGWNLADAPADFDFLDFHTAYWGAINNAAHYEAWRNDTQPDLTGSWKITYDRTGTVHAAERLTPAGKYV